MTRLPGGVPDVPLDVSDYVSDWPVETRSFTIHVEELSDGSQRITVGRNMQIHEFSDMFDAFSYIEEECS